MIYSNKIEKIAPSVTLAMTARSKKMREEGINVIDFGIGEPDFNTPNYIIEAAVEAMRKGFTKYTDASGIKQLKEAIIDKFQKDNNLKYSTSQIIVSTGAKQCLSNALQAILNPGDEVIISVPYWVSYPELVNLADGVPVYVNTKEENNFKYKLEDLNKAITSKTKAIIITSPNNPTGSVYTKDELLWLAEFAKKNDLIIISDEIYEKLIYGEEKHISIASLSEDAYERTIVINGVSKSFAMTGWRIGYAAANEHITKLMSNIQSHTTSNPNSIAQYASLAALTCGNHEEMKTMVDEFKRRRDFMFERINKIKNLSCIKPEGAFYVIINISKILNKKINGTLISDSMIFSNLLLEDAKVTVIPGAALGVDNFIRLSYATSMESIQEGLNRLENFVNNI